VRTVCGSGVPLTTGPVWMPGGLGAFTTSDPPSWKNISGGGRATVLNVMALLMTVIGVMVGVTVVTAAAVGALMLFTTFVKPAATAVTHVSAAAEDSSAAFKLTTLTVRRRRRVVWRSRRMLCTTNPLGRAAA